MVRLAKAIVVLPLVASVRKRRAQAAACGSCTECIAVPGNNQGATDAHCAPCALNGQTWWPCNVDGACQCASGSEPTPTPAPTPLPPAPTPSPTPTTPPTPSPPTPAPVPSPPASALVQRLVNALNQVDYQFLKLQPTATDKCSIVTAASCMEPSQVYFWNDMVAAVSKMAEVGVGGEKLYAGTDAPDGHKYALANIAAFLAQTMQETIQYDACDENNWSDKSTVDSHGGTLYSSAAACGQIGQSYQDYKCSAGSVDEDGNPIDPSELQCQVDNGMEMVAETHALWYGAPAPLFCAPKSKIPAAPRWDYGGWCPTKGSSWNQGDAFAPPFDTMSRGSIFYGPGVKTDNVPPEVLAVKPSYLDYVKSAIDGSTGDACMTGNNFTCCMDVDNQRAGQWKSCGGGACSNPPAPNFGRDARTDVEGCCWWGRGVIQTTGVCNFGRLNYFMGTKAATRGRDALYPTVDFCRDPEVICRNEHPDLKWIAGFFYWVDAVQPFTASSAKQMQRSLSPGAGSPLQPTSLAQEKQNTSTTSIPPEDYMQVLHDWVDNGMRTDDHTLVDLSSGLVNRGCAWAPFEQGEACSPADGSVPYTTQPCVNGYIHAACTRRVNFQYILNILKPAFDYRGP